MLKDANCVFRWLFKVLAWTKVTQAIEENSVFNAFPEICFVILTAI